MRALTGRRAAPSGVPDGATARRAAAAGVPAAAGRRRAALPFVPGALTRRRAASPFVPGATPADLAWVPDEASRDFLGNEFLLWLWFKLDADDDTLPLSDGSEVAALLARTLVLECPRGQTGRETISSDGPARLPEARRAIQAGKLPRKAGLTLVRHDRQYELTLQAETLAVSGGRLPAPEEIDDRARLEERVTTLRHLLETLDLLYDSFGRVRLGGGWPKELVRLQKWLRSDDRGRLSAIG